MGKGILPTPPPTLPPKDNSACQFTDARKDLMMLYWGQNDYEGNLRDYCQDDRYDIIQISFLNNFPAEPLPWGQLNFASHCETTFQDGSKLLHCPLIGYDIKFCQQKGKQVLISMGGAIGQYGFQSQAQAEDFALAMWNRYMGGSSNKRPFDDAIVDGIDLDIENNNNKYYAAFVNRLRQLYATDPSRKYLIAAAPQCVYPDYNVGPDDARIQGSVLQNSWIDIVAIQFYNNPGCDATYGNLPQSFTQWNNWAKNSVNKNVRLLAGFPGSDRAAGSGFVTPSSIRTQLNDLVRGSSNFGGVMFWDAGHARDSGLGPQTADWLKTLYPCKGGSGTQAPTQAPTTKPPATQAPTQPATQAPTQPATQAPTQPATQAPTKPATQAPTQPATQAPTQAPTQPATQAPTQPATSQPPASGKRCVGVGLYRGGAAMGATIAFQDDNKVDLNVVISSGGWAACSVRYQATAQSTNWYQHLEATASPASPCARSYRVFRDPASGQVVSMVGDQGEVLLSVTCN
jgi:chitinase